MSQVNRFLFSVAILTVAGSAGCSQVPRQPLPEISQKQLEPYLT